MEFDTDRLLNAFEKAFGVKLLPAQVRGLQSEIQAWDFCIASAREKPTNRTFEPADMDPSLGFRELARELPNGFHRVAATVGFFSNAKFLVGPVNDDEQVFFADLDGDLGRHSVFAYEGRFAWLSSRPFPSITDWLESGAVCAKASQEQGVASAREHRPDRISRRVNWLVIGLAGLDAGGDEFKDVPSLDTFERERSLLWRPHLSAYWLLHHFVAGNAELLTQTVETLPIVNHPWVDEIRDYVQRPQGSIGGIDAEFIDKFAQCAPDSSFGD